MGRYLYKSMDKVLISYYRLFLFIQPSNWLSKVRSVVKMVLMNAAQANWQVKLVEAECFRTEGICETKVLFQRKTSSEQKKHRPANCEPMNE